MKEIEIIDVVEEEPKKTKKSNKTKKNTKNKKKNKVNLWFKTFLILDVLAAICLVIVYGPWDGFRNFWVTSSMTTMTHKYLARTLYSEEEIQRTLNKNTVEMIDQNTDVSAIVFSDNKDTGVYESVYEEQILKHDEGNDLYKKFTIKVNNSTAHVTVIYDPSRIHYATSSKINNGGQKLVDLAKENEAIIAMNASAFSKKGRKLTPLGVVIKEGKILYEGALARDWGIVGFTKEHVLMLTTKSAKEAVADGMWDAMTFGPLLYVNGQAAKINGNGGYGYAPRTVIAQRKDGIVLFIVFDGRDLGKRALGASMNDLIEILTRYKAYNAANLDGGGSSTLVINNEVVNETGGWSYSGDRYIPDAWIVK